MDLKTKKKHFHERNCFFFSLPVVCLSSLISDQSQRLQRMIGDKKLAMLV